MRLLALTLLASAATPAMAQHHAGHDMSGMTMGAPAAADCPADTDSHAETGNAEGSRTVSADGCDTGGNAEPIEKAMADEMEMDHSQMNHDRMGHGDKGHSAMAEMDHGSVDHGSMGHSQMNHDAMGPAPIPIGAAPASAGSGPPSAADEIWGVEAMAPSRAALRHENGGQAFAKVMVNRIEYHAREGQDGYAWEGQAWFGGDLDRLLLKSEGEGTFGGEAEQAELQALWSHAIGPWFDLNAGVRHDFAGPARTHLAVGIQGIVPYQFEVSGSVFLSDKGELTARAEADIDQRITQRLIVQPRVELNLSAQDIPELGIGAGLDKAEVGLRLRYEFSREFAPYVGVSQQWLGGKAADYARAKGDGASTTSLVAGLRLWF